MLSLSFVFQHTHTHTHNCYSYQFSRDVLSLYARYTSKLIASILEPTHTHTPHTPVFRHCTTDSATCPPTAPTSAMSESESSFRKIPLPATNAYDIKRICVVHWDTTPLVEGQSSSFVIVKPLREAERLPNNEAIIKIEGVWYEQLSENNAKTFKLGDQINVIFSNIDGRIKWLEKRDESQANSTFNKGFT